MLSILEVAGALWRDARRCSRGLGRRLGASLLALSIAACGGGGGGDSSAGAAGAGATGEAVISITDAPGEFVAYTVDVVSLSLTRANGAVVEVLPNRTRIDFAQLTELTEFLTAATVPQGNYTDARIRLDYSNADIKVEDNAGNAVSAQVRDASGNAIGTVDLAIKFDNLRHLVIAPGIPAHVTLDFNLEASNTVDLGTTPPTVRVQPILVADVTPERVKPHRVRGPLLSVNTTNASYRVAIRPFHRHGTDHGELTVQVSPSTVFEINGVNAQGNTGLAQLAALPTFSATLAIGNLDVSNRRFHADEVYAGSSVPFGASDVVQGSVGARSGNSLTVIGASLQRADGTLTFTDSITVNVGGTTKVTRAGQIITGQGATIADLSVGSTITAFGRLSGSVLDAATSADLVRLGVTTMGATVNSVAAGRARVTVQRINGRLLSRYNFAGTGTAGNDALGNDYEVNTGALSLAGIVAATPVRIRGFVQPFGQAPEDFDAQSIVNLSTVPANMLVDWEPAAAAPFAAAGSSALMLNLAGAPTLHHVYRLGVATDLKAAPYASRAPGVQPDGNGRGLFALAQPGSVQVFTTFAGYVSALQLELAGGKTLDGMAAHGTFDDATVAMIAHLVAAKLK